MAAQMNIAWQQIAVNRFGLGARAGQAWPENPHAWLELQFGRYRAETPSMRDQSTAESLIRTELLRRRNERQLSPEARQESRQQANRQARDSYTEAIRIRVVESVLGDTPFVEHLVHFWANHFALSVEKPEVLALAGPFEREAIRPFVLGRFADMLMAVERHPAMLLYLDQDRSVGPDSPLAQRQSQRDPQHPRGLNENLAREIMELHTLGVRSGYSQNDVTEFARALTGISLVREDEVDDGGVVVRFRAQWHEPGVRQVLGRRYDQPGEAQADAMLADFARSPATAAHIAHKLVAHFVADPPPQQIVEAVRQAFMRSAGDLPTVYRALWADAHVRTMPERFKTPWLWMISALRALGEVPDLPYANWLGVLGQPVWKPGSPAGYAPPGTAWMAPDALLRRVQMAPRLARRAGRMLDPRQLAQQLWPTGAGQATVEAVAHADAHDVGLALLLVSPEFLRC